MTYLTGETGFFYRQRVHKLIALVEIAAEFVRLKVDVILAVGTEAALAAKQTTAVIPIFFR